MSRRRNRFGIAAAVAFAMMGIGCYSREPMLAPDNGGEGGGGGGGGSGGGGGGAEDQVPRAELQKVVQQRDAFKQQQRATIQLFANTLGIDPDEVKIVATGDKDNPFKLEAPGLDDISTVVKEARGKKSVKWEDREAELNSKHQKALQKTLEGTNKKVTGATSALQKLAVTTPLRAAFIEKGAIDPDAAMKLSADRVRSTVEFDEESGEPALKIEYLAEDGTPMLDAAGKPVTGEQFAEKFFEKHAYLRKATVRSGSGAGGGGKLPGSSLGNMTFAERGVAAADALFGQVPKK